MSTRAKFFVAAKSETAAGPGRPNEGEKVVFNVVYGDSPENKEWSKYTPWGTIEMGITNPDVYKQFKVGDCYFVDFTLVEEKK